MSNPKVRQEDKETGVVVQSFLEYLTIYPLPLWSIDMNENASALGKLGKGKPKRITDADRERRRTVMRANQAKRWAKKGEK